jgi:hypothetical protein
LQFRQVKGACCGERSSRATMRLSRVRPVPYAATCFAGEIENRRIDIEDARACHHVAQNVLAFGDGTALDVANLGPHRLGTRPGQRPACAIAIIIAEIGKKDFAIVRRLRAEEQKMKPSIRRTSGALRAHASIGGVRVARVTPWHCFVTMELLGMH